MFGSGGGERLAKEHGIPFLGRIPIDSVSPHVCLCVSVALTRVSSLSAAQTLVESCERGQSVLTSFPSSRISATLSELATELDSKLS